MGFKTLNSILTPKLSKNIISIIIISILLGTLMISGCIDNNGREPPQVGVSPTIPAQTTDLIGNWRIYSSRLFYDQGGGGTVDTTATRQLQLNLDLTYQFGDSVGTWSVASISPDDWKRWGVEQFSPTKKIVLKGWNGGTADGPIEESAGVDFIWVIYKVEPPIVSAPGTVHMKFGRASLNGKESSGKESSPPPQTGSAIKTVVGIYRCESITDPEGTRPCDTRITMELNEDGSWSWASASGSFTVENGKVVFTSPYAGGRGFASQGPADWGSAIIGDGTITFDQDVNRVVRWVLIT